MVYGSGCKQFGGAQGAPLSYLNTKYVEPSGSEGSNRLISEPLLARPSLNHTGGRRMKRSTRKRRHTRKSRKGGFYPSAMGGLINNGAKLLPAAGVQAYRMVRNYKNSRKSRK